MDEESLADVRRDNAIKTRCVRFGVDYVERRHGETSAEQQQRHNTLQKAIERERKRRARAQQSLDERRSTQDADTAARKRTRAQQSPERTRAQQSQEERDDGRRQDREARRRKRSVDDTRDSVFNDNCFHTLNPPDENFKKSLVMKAIKQAIRTNRPNGTHQVKVCVMCDRESLGKRRCAIYQPKDLRKIDIA
eukprot:scaffold16639_cov202-Skeletonema_marinoi.AAC.1